MLVTNLDIGVFCVGSVVRVPISVCNNSPDITISDVSVIIEHPGGLQYSTTNLPKGEYNEATNTWVLGTLEKDSCVVGEIEYIVTDDSQGEFKVNYTVATTSNCPICTDSVGCINISGLGCGEIGKCTNSNIAEPKRVLCGSGVECTGNVTLGDGGCSAGLIKTYDWIETSIAMGTITGTPESFTYVPNEGFCGVGNAKYGIYCAGTLVEEVDVRFDVTCANSSEYKEYIFANSTSSDIPIFLPDGTQGIKELNVSLNDFPCFYGADTTWHLVSDPTANGEGLSEPTSSANVTILTWNQLTGFFVAQAQNLFTGEARFEYTIRCRDSENNLVYETEPTMVVLEIRAPE